MRVVITGHTSGIGKSTKEVLEEEGFQVEGLSRSTGHDLEKEYEHVYHSILEHDPDVFINNSYVKENQTRLLKEIYDEWKYKKKIIINIGSVASLIPPDSPDYEMPYAKDKRYQREFCQEKNFLYSKKNYDKIKCGLSNVNCDYVKTMFKSKYDKRLFPNLDPREVADVILYVIGSINRGVCIREVNLHSSREPEL